MVRAPFFLLAAAGLSLTALTLPAAAAEPGALRICTGGPSGNYTFAGKEIAGRLASTFKEVKIVPTGGSLDNLRKLVSGECDMGFSQSDVADLYRIENPSAMSVLYPFKTIYTEYTQILCPTKTGWTKLSDLAEARKKGAPVKMIVGPNGSGPAETWRAIRQSNPDAYDKIERVPDSPDITAASKVKDSADTCMLWVSGLNSGDMVSANDMSVRTRDHKPALSLISVDDKNVFSIKDSNGQPIYKSEKVSARAPAKNKAGMYQNLIPDRGGYFSTDMSVTVAAVDAVLMTTNAVRDQIKGQSGAIVQAIEDAQPTIWNKANPEAN